MKRQGETESEYQWRIKCSAAIIGLYGACELCIAIDMDPRDLLELVRDHIPHFRAAKAEAAKPTT